MSVLDWFFGRGTTTMWNPEIYPFPDSNTLLAKVSISHLSPGGSVLRFVPCPLGGRVTHIPRFLTGLAL